MYLTSFHDGMYKKKNLRFDAKKKPVYISVFLEIIYIYQFWKNDKGTPLILFKKHDKIGFHRVKWIFL